VTGQVVRRPLFFKEMRLRTRYRFSERGEWPVDVQVLAEGVKEIGVNTWGGEARLVLAREIGDLTIVANGVGEARLVGSLDDRVVSVGWAGGLTYDLFPEWKLGVESWGRLEVANELGDKEELAAYVGPAIAWAPSSGFWATITPAAGLTEVANEIEVRLALGMHLQ
jgi:hypothetical protein